MREATFTAKLLRELKKHPALAEAVVWKFNDRVTAGIPDFVIITGRKSLWCEVKIVPNRVSKLQQYYLRKIGDGGALITASPDGNYGSVINETSSRYGIDFRELVEEIVRRAVN